MKNKIKTCLKILVSVAILFVILQTFFSEGTKPYCTVKEYSYQNEETEGLSNPVQDTMVSQSFMSEGNIITNISVYMTNVDCDSLDIFLSDSNGKIVQEISVNPEEYESNAWNRIAFDCKVKKESEYILSFQSEQGLDFLLLDRGEKPETFLACETSQGKVEAALVMGLQQTYSYISFASSLELIFSCLVALLMGLALCYAVFHIEKLVKNFSESEKKKGLRYAVYFAVSLVFLYNPIDGVRTEVTSFDRVFGSGFISNVDVAKRITNFNHWFIYFGIVVTLFYLLANYCLQKEYCKEKSKVIGFLNQLMILADINLLFCCITYFLDEEKMQTVFYYSSSVIMLIVLVCIAYLVFGLDRKIDAEVLLKLEVMAFSIAYPIAIISKLELQGGKLLFGMQAIFMLLIIPLSYCFGNLFRTKKGFALVNAGVITTALIPFATSFYIELINILNQHNIFVVHLRRYYVLGVGIGIVLTLLLAICIEKKNLILGKWKTWSYLWLIFGITCFNAQIPLQGTYDADIFESANYSILISDFLNFGEIPLVEHYGGHMMEGVWEGLIYALLNNDVAGAIFSPYSGYIMTVLAVLFFFLIRKIWNEDMALLVTLFFPFYNYWERYGLGMLLCLAVWAYVKKNTYLRAAMVWLAFIWCAVYRLDLGFSVGIACILAMIIYVIAYKNKKAAKQLLITLVVWGIFGVALWTILCLTNDINPVDRLVEFLLINMSNQNWAYAGIGDISMGLFSWCYLVIPFVMIGCLLYVVFSKTYREKIGDEIWLTLLILGFAYFTNFSRGIVRHSLLEGQTAIVLWDAYIFLAIFVCYFLNKKTLFLPMFAVLILCGSFLKSPINYQNSPIADSSASKVGNFTETNWLQLKDNGECIVRTEWSDSLKATIEPYEVVLNTLLEEDETFVDFANKSFVYSAINRRNPVYVSQAPLQLSGEYTQEQFIKEMKNIPVVLIPMDDTRLATNLDGLPNAYRYYKVSEYIYQNYVPLCSYGTSFAVWCLPERYKEFKSKIEPLALATEETEVSFIEYGYDAPTACVNEDGTSYYSYDNGFHTYSIAYLASIWAENDDAVNNTKYCSLEKNNGVYTFDRSQIQTDVNGNYLLLNAYYGGTDAGASYQENDETTNAVVKLGIYEDGQFIEKYQYGITIKEGSHDYLLRISSDYNWYLGDVNAVTISCDGALHDVNMKILEGD